MAIELRVPALGESVREATLGAWKHAEGDTVSVDEPLVEVESEKATVEVPSPGTGVLKKILRKAGETVAVGEVIAEIDQTAVGATKAPAKPANGKSSNGEGKGKPAAEAPLRAGPRPPPRRAPRRPAPPPTPAASASSRCRCCARPSRAAWSRRSRRRRS